MTAAATLPPQPWMTAPDTRAVLDALAAGGADVRFVGGCVRDAWIGRPVRDIDLATHAPPERVMALLEAAGLRAIPTGIVHGTVTAVTGRSHYEITTLRRDVETFGRHARVAFTDDWREDAARRDFTMNALSCAPNGMLFDPFGGLDDLAAGRVRFVGDPCQRIAEDVLRLLRFFRFHAHYGRGTPDGDALAACAAAAPGLAGLSGERVQGELLRLLAAPDPAAVWRLMAGLGVIRHLLPVPTDPARLARLVAVERALGEEGAPRLRLAALLPRGRTAVHAAAERLALSNADRAGLLVLADPPLALPIRWTESGLRRQLYRIGDADRFRDLLRLRVADAPGPWPVERLRHALALADALPGLRLPIAGRDLLALGVPRGPAIGVILRAVESWWMACDFRPGLEECLERAARAAADAGGGRMRPWQSTPWPHPVPGTGPVGRAG